MSASVSLGNWLAIIATAALLLLLTIGEGGRWLIAAGLPPAPAPSTWPETDLARQAGWLTWVGSEQ